MPWYEAIRWILLLLRGLESVRWLVEDPQHRKVADELIERAGKEIPGLAVRYGDDGAPGVDAVEPMAKEQDSVVVDEVRVVVEKHRRICRPGIDTIE